MSHTQINIASVKSDFINGKISNKEYILKLLYSRNAWDTKMAKILKDSDDLTIYELHDALLLEKIAYAEEHNVMYKSSKITIPTMLDPYDIEMSLMYRYHFRLILTYATRNPSDGMLGVYMEKGVNEGIYDTSMHTFYSLIKEFEQKTIKRQQDEVIHGLSLLAPVVTLTKEPHWIVCNNGIFDKQSKTLLPFSPEHIYISKAATDYNPLAYNPTITLSDGTLWDVDSWLLEVADNDTEIYDLLWEVASDFIQSGFNREKVPILYGKNGRNGKGTYGALLEEIVGRDRVANLAIADFKEEFLKEQLINAVGVIAHENDVDGYIDSMKDFKAAATGDTLTINRKYEKPVRFQFTGTIIQMMNGMPRIKDRSGSLYRRLLIVPFNRQFPFDDAKKDIKDVLIKRQDVKEYVFFKACHNDFTAFTEPSQSRDLLEQYKEMNDPIRQFWGEIESEIKWDLLPTNFVYDLYKEWSHRNNPNGKIMGKNNFLDDLRVVIDEHDEWEDSTRKPVRSTPRMDSDEPLITEYNLTNWMDKSSRSADVVKLRNFPRSNAYRGFVRN